MVKEFEIEISCRIGACDTKEEAENILTYLKTKFVRFDRYDDDQLNVVYNAFVLTKVNADIVAEWDPKTMSADEMKIRHQGLRPDFYNRCHSIAIATQHGFNGMQSMMPSSNLNLQNPLNMNTPDSWGNNF